MPWYKPPPAHDPCERGQVNQQCLVRRPVNQRLSSWESRGHSKSHWVRREFRRRRWHPTPELLPGKSHGWRSLVGYSPWGREESDTTEQLHFLLLFGYYIKTRLLQSGLSQFYLELSLGLLVNQEFLLLYHS